MKAAIMRIQIARMLPLLMIGALAACSPDAADPDMGTLTGAMPLIPPPVVVREQQRAISLRLSGNGAMSAAEAQRFDSFLIGVSAGKPDAVHLVISGNPTPHAIEVVTHRAFARGIAANKIAIARSGVSDSSGAMTVDVTANTYVAALPNCPQTAHLNTSDGDNMLSSDWGCATVSNLELMVADPRDLVRGQSGGLTDSVVTSAAIVRLQTDKVKKLEAPATSTAAPASGGQ
jgi:pilus assembly protein CpaD